MVHGKVTTRGCRDSHGRPHSFFLCDCRNQKKVGGAAGAGAAISFDIQNILQRDCLDVASSSNYPELFPRHIPTLFLVTTLTSLQTHHLPPWPLPALVLRHSRSSSTSPRLLRTCSCQKSKLNCSCHQVCLQESQSLIGTHLTFVARRHQTLWPLEDSQLRINARHCTDDTL